MLTFLTPCLIVGDKSLVDTVAHEIGPSPPCLCLPSTNALMTPLALSPLSLLIAVAPPRHPHTHNTQHTAHSWFGNYVTNASWSEFFLNEGFTQYAQRRITGLVLGEEYTALEALAGWDGLLADLREFGDASPLTRLRVPLEGPEDDPEDVYNDVPCACVFC
jgi:hypothetical protein